MQNQNFFIRKIVGFIFILVYYNLLFFFFAPDMLNDPFVLLAFLIYYIYMLIEQIYKIEPSEEYQVQRRDILIIGIFLIHPILLILSYYERELLILEFLPFWTDNIVKLAAIGLLVIGTLIAFTSRLQLGKYGTTIITIEDDHQLITSGIYKYIRHPIYLGSITLFTSIGIAVGSLFITSIVFLAWLFMLKERIELEERLLTEKFGEEYLEYKKRTKKLIPFLY